MESDPRAPFENLPLPPLAIKAFPSRPNSHAPSLPYVSSLCCTPSHTPDLPYISVPFPSLFPMADTESKNLKRFRVDSDNSLESQTESHPDSPVAKRLRANLLEILDDSDNAGDRNDDLASVMKSFEEEIASSLSQPPALNSGERPPDLGYLLEASDDELGLPPTTSESDHVAVRGPFEAEGFGQMWGFEDEIPSYDALEFGIRHVNENEEEEAAFVFEGLFDYSDVGCGPSDFSNVSWQPETLPAL